MHDNHTTTDQGIFINRQRLRHALAFGVCLCIALVLIAWLNIGNPQPPAAEWRPAPDPPLVDNSVRVEILSNNQLFSNNQTCIGVCR